MNAVAFAWRSLVRQPARATLGMLGVAAVGALLFDMLLLSEGLVISMRDLLERLDFDIRITATDALPGSGGPDIQDATRAAATIRALPSVRAVVTMRFGEVSIERPGAAPVRGFFESAGGPPSLAGTRPSFGVAGPSSPRSAGSSTPLTDNSSAPLGAGPSTSLGAGGSVRPWTILSGQDVRSERDLLLDETGARLLGVGAGATVTVRASCSIEREALPPVTFRVSGVAAFPFDTPSDMTVATTAAGFAQACGEEDADVADAILVTTSGDPATTAADIVEARPDLRAFTTEQVIGRLSESGFTYFRQISTVLTAVTVSFALLLITVLLTVSVNQRLGEIAALRALGFSRARVVADVLSESVLIVGIGGALSLPLGLGLAGGLDRILKQMPGIPEQLHFFVFEPQALGIHAALLAATAIIAALYPMRIVARLPIAATLRNEVIS